MVTDLTSLVGVALPASLASGVARAAIDDCDRCVNVSFTRLQHERAGYFFDLAAL